MYTVKVMFMTSSFHISYCIQHIKLELSALRKKGNVVFSSSSSSSSSSEERYSLLRVQQPNYLRMEQRDCVICARDDAMR